MIFLTIIILIVMKITFQHHFQAVGSRNDDDYTIFVRIAHSCVSNPQLLSLHPNSYEVYSHPNPSTNPYSYPNPNPNPYPYPYLHPHPHPNPHPNPSSNLNPNPNPNSNPPSILPSNFVIFIFLRKDLIDYEPILCDH